MVDIGEGAIGLPFGAVLVKSDCIIKSVAELGQNLKLLLPEPDVVMIVAYQGTCNREPY